MATSVCRILVFALIVCLPMTAFADDDECPEIAVGAVDVELPPPSAEDVRAAIALYDRAHARLEAAISASVGAVGDVAGGVGDVAGGLTGGLTGTVDATANATGFVRIDAGVANEVIPDLEEAFRLGRDPKVLGDLGLAYHGAGRLEAAWIALYRFKMEARAEYEADRARIDAAMRDLEPRLGAVMISASGNVDAAADAEVWFDGQAIARLPLNEAIYLAAGHKSLRIRSRVRAGIEADVDADVQVGQTVRVDAELPDAPSVGVGAPDASVDAGGPPLAMWIVGAVGVAVVIGAIIATIIHANISSDLDAPDLSVDARADLEDDLSFANTMRIGGFVLGGVGLVAALVIFLIADAAGPDCPSGVAMCPGRNLASRPPLQLSPYVSEEGFGAGLTATF